MNWDAVGAIGEVVGAGGVIFTLLYLAIQIRQSNRLAKFQTYRDIMAQADEANRLGVSDSGPMALLLKDPDSLTKEESERIWLWTVLLCNTATNVQIAYDEGLIDEDLLLAGKNAVSHSIKEYPSMGANFVRWAELQPSLSEKVVFEEVRKLMDDSSKAGQE